ncbi:DUF1826 domain-containing protein [Qipengyuania qiaonensis]|uniref:DUF1826 domain-containing protein n=1 Tax=Qipengyuania qiaonensis TaxID=2867240 RepID=A0ABS7JFK9_9SPHN|nr:DUF1826 domain-containing protein [Qipengyuania qiaonensis]MBX7483822.1 DUF1826 domain-containing protein [Qipengyuania qiaonensis]
MDEGPHEEYLRSIPRRWDAIAEPQTCLVIEPRKTDKAGDASAALLDIEPFCRSAAGSVSEAIMQLADLPPAILRDIESLASRFADLTGSNHVRIRLAQIVTNSCRKVHADYTDLRLITTYAGPGTQFALDNNPDAETLLDVPVGHVGLLKGRRYGANHAPCYHRSPPAADLGVKRLVLVIDTETFTSETESGCGGQKTGKLA